MRKLATAAFSFAAATWVAQYFLSYNALALSILFTFLIIPAMLSRRRNGLRLGIICAFTALGFFWSWAHMAIFVQSGNELSGQVLTTEARVLEFPVEYDDYTLISVKLMDENLPKIETSLFVTAEIPDLQPGDIVKGDFSFRSASLRYDRETGRYISKGTYALASLKSELEVTGRWNFSFLYFPQHISRYIHSMVELVFPEDAIPFQMALLTGEKGLLYDDNVLNTAMSTTGISHVVSISGMHVAFLVGMVRSLTGRRRSTAAICIPLILVFIPMTGGSASVIRAGVMQIMLLVAPLLKRESDSITSLGFVLALLLLQNPASIQSTGLQLSFTAMAGIILVTPRVYSALESKCGKLLKRPFVGKIIHLTISSFSSTIGALVFTTPIVAWQFGVVSLISPITNLLTLSAVSICFSAGYLCCILGMIAPVTGAALGGLLAWVVRYIVEVILLLARLPFAAVYTSNGFVSFWLFLTYIFFSVCLFMRGDRRFRLTVPLSLSVITLLVALITPSLVNSAYSGVITAIDVGQGQSIAMFSGRSTLLIDCGSSDEYSPGQTVANYLISQNRFTVDTLLLTHLHRDHAGGVTELMSRIPVSRIIMPAGDSDEDGILDEILEMAEHQGTEIIYIEQDSVAQLADCTLTIHAPSGVKNANERGIVIEAEIEDFTMLVTGDINMTTERILMRKSTLPDVDLLIVGHHGSKNSTGVELLEATKPEIAIISVGFNTYGHPTLEVLYRLYIADAQIYRTDYHGNITIRVK